MDLFLNGFRLFRTSSTHGIYFLMVYSWSSTELNTFQHCELCENPSKCEICLPFLTSHIRHLKASAVFLNVHTEQSHQSSITFCVLLGLLIFEFFWSIIHCKSTGKFNSLWPRSSTLLFTRQPSFYGSYCQRATKQLSESNSQYNKRGKGRQNKIVYRMNKYNQTFHNNKRGNTQCMCSFQNIHGFFSTQ